MVAVETSVSLPLAPPTWVQLGCVSSHGWNQNRKAGCRPGVLIQGQEFSFLSCLLKLCV